jgi:hypothetical protein
MLANRQSGVNGKSCSTSASQEPSIPNHRRAYPKSIRARCTLEKIFVLANQFAPRTDATSSLDEGRFLETILKTEQGVAFRGGGS